MAGYDGVIRIITKIEVKDAENSLAGLEWQIKSSAKYMDELRSKMDELKDQKIPTDKYKNLQSSLTDAEKELSRLVAQQEKYIELGFNSGSAWDLINEKVASASDKVDSIKAKMQSLTDAGKDFVLGKDTWLYAMYAQQLLEEEEAVLKAGEKYRELSEKTPKALERQAEVQRKIEEQAERNLQRENARIQKEAEIQAKLEAEAAEEERLDQIRVNAVATNDQMIAKTERLRQLEQEIAELKSLGITEGYADYENRILETDRLKQDIRDYRDSLSEVPERFSRVREAAQKAFHAIRSGLSTVGKAGDTVFSGMISMAEKMYSVMTRGTKKSSGLFSTLASWMKGLALSLLIFNWISKGFNAMISGMKTGFNNFMGYSDSFANSIQSMKNSMATLGNQFAAAFAPIIQMVIPCLNALIGAITTAMSYVAQFIAVLGGSSTFTRAKKVQDSYNKSLGGTAAAAKKAYGALAKFDDLDVLQKQEDASGGGAGGAAGAGDLFEEVPVSDKFKDVFEWIKEMWENSDFYKLGELIGRKLKEALESIPWEPVKNTARKIGKSIATLLNGFIEVKDLGYSIGRTLTEAVNTGFEALNRFVNNFHFESLGKFISDGLNGLIENVDWPLIRDTFVKGFEGLADSVNSFIAGFRWDNLSESASNIVNTISGSVYGFFSRISWKDLGKNVGDQITKAVRGTDWKQIGRALGSIIQSALDLVKSLVRKINMSDIVKAVTDTMEGFFRSASMGDIASVILGILATRLAASAAISVFDSAAAAIMGSLADAIGGAASAAFSSITDTIYAVLGNVLTPSVSLAVAAVAGLATAFYELNRRVEEQTQMEVFGDRLDNITGRIHQQTEAIKNRSEASMDYVKNAGMAEAAMAEDLADRYFNLADKENKTNEETAEMQRLAGLLVDKLPELQAYYNEQTGLIDATRESIGQLVEERLKEIRLGAVEEALTKQYEEQANALMAVQDAIEPANQAQEHMNRLNEEYQSLLDKAGQLEAYNSLSEQINSCTGNTEELVSQQAELWNEITNGGTESFPTFDSLTQKMGEVNQKLYDFQDEYKEALETLSDASDTYSAVETNISELTEMLTSGMTEAAGYAASGYADKMASDTSMTDSTLEQARDLLEGFNRALDINSPSGKFKESAGYAIEGWNAGIAENKPSVLSGMIALAAEIADAFRQTFSEQSVLLGISVLEMLGLLNENMEMIFTEMLEMISGKWTELLEQSALSWTQLSDLLKDTLAVIRKNILDTLTTIHADWNVKWTQLVQKARQSCQEVTGSVNTMQRNIQSACNAMIASINALIASMEKLKSAASSLGSVGGGFGGSSGGGGSRRAAVPAMASYSTQSMQALTDSLPQLASGAVIRGGNPFMAILGDQPRGITNIEAPLPTMVEAFKQAVSEMGGVGGNGRVPVNINLNYDGETFARLSISDILSELGRQGYNVDILGVT